MNNNNDNNISVVQPQDINLQPLESGRRRRRKAKAIEWVPIEQPIAGCPRGLETLLKTNNVKIKQKIEWNDAFAGMQSNNQFLIQTLEGKTIFLAFENSSFWTRLVCGSERGFKFHLVDDHNLESLRITRQFKCCAGWCWCAGCCRACAYELRIESAGEIMGYVRQRGSKWRTYFDLLDAEYRCIFKIISPCFTNDGPCCPATNEFQIIDAETLSMCGLMTKEYSSYSTVPLSNTDLFVIDFPLETDVRMKATIIGAYLLLDMLYYESDR